MRLIKRAIAAAIIALPSLGVAQISSLTNIDKYKTRSESFNHNTHVIFDLENYEYYASIDNPAYVQFYRDQLAKADSARANDFLSLATEYGYKDTDGEYLSYKGRKSVLGSIQATGETGYKGVGAMYGSISYEMRNDSDTKLNYTHRYMDYYPYIVADTVSIGDTKSDSYKIDGGFSFKTGKVYLGLAGSYAGVVSRRLTDPRYSNYHSLLSLDFGMGYEFNRHILLAKISPRFSWQATAVNDYSLRGAKYYQLYGFGLWNRKESAGGYSYNRMMTTNGVEFGTSFSRVRAGKKELGYLFDIDASYNSMNTLETNSKNLFSSATFYINPEASLFGSINDWDLNILTGYHLSNRKGTEHTYEKQLVDEENKLYDNVKVASSELYSLINSSLNLQMKAAYNISSIHKIHMLAGGVAEHYEEKYEAPYRAIKNTWIDSHIGLGYSLGLDRNDLDIFLSAHKTYNMSNTMDVNLVDDYLTRELVYIPYFLRSMDSNALKLEAKYNFHLKNKDQIGFVANATYAKLASDLSMDEHTEYMFSKENSQLNLNLMIFYSF